MDATKWVNPYEGLTIVEASPSTTVEATRQLNSYEAVTIALVDGQRIQAPTPAMIHGEGPAAIPRCEHGNSPGSFRGCPACRERDEEIRKAVQPLADEFWAHRGERDIEHLLLRAYRMGMKHVETAP